MPAAAHDHAHEHARVTITAHDHATTMIMRHDHDHHDHDHHHHDEHCDHDIITATPMLMTTNERRPAGARRDDGRRGGGAVPADDLAVAGLSGRRASPIPAASNGRWRPAISPMPPRCSDWLAAMLDRRLRLLRRRVSGAGASRRVAARRCRACARSPNSPPPSCPRASASSRRRRRAAPSSRSRARPGIATGSTQAIAQCDGAIVYPVAVGIVSAAHAIPLAPALHAFLHALVSNWISAGAPAHSARADRQPARAGGAGAGGRRDREARARSHARRSRQRDLPRRSRQPAPRDAIYEAVPVMTSSRRPAKRDP